MNHEHIIKRADGGKVRIRIHLVGITGLPEWIIDGEICAPRCRTWTPCVNTNLHSYRALDTAGRRKYAIESVLAVASQEEIQQALDEAWNKIRPTMHNGIIKSGTLA